MAVPAPKSNTPHEQQITDWSDLGREMWSFLTGRQAAIDYTFQDLSIEVPRDTGPQAQHAVWRLNGTLRITTTEHAGSSDGQAG